MKAELTSDGFDVLIVNLEGVAEKSKNFNDLSSELRSIFQEDLKLRFASSPDVETGGEVYGGVFWEKLSEVTLRQRKNGKILIDSRDLEKSLTVEGDGNNLFEVTNGTEVMFGSLLPYANKVNVNRPFLFWHPILLENIAGAIAGWLKKDFNG